MTAPQPIEAPRPNPSTGPKVVSSSSTKTPEGMRRCSLKRRFHSSTKICVLTPDEQQAYDKHSNIVLEALAPIGDYERLIAQTSFPLFDRSIADDRWRLNRARAIEAGTFAAGMHGPAAADTAQPEIDDAFAQSRIWAEQARNLDLLTIYEQTSFPLFDQRIQRSIDKNTAHLKTLQSERKQVAQEAMREAKLLYRLAQAGGKPYQPEAYFTTSPEVRESVFSTTEIAAGLSREKLFHNARICARFGDLPKESAAAKAHNPQPTTHSPQPTGQGPTATGRLIDR